MVVIGSQYNNVRIKRSFITCMLHQILLGDYTEEDEIGRACSMHRRNKKLLQDFYWKT